MPMLVFIYIYLEKGLYPTDQLCFQWWEIWGAFPCAEILYQIENPKSNKYETYNKKWDRPRGPMLTFGGVCTCFGTDWEGKTGVDASEHDLERLILDGSLIEHSENGVHRVGCQKWQTTFWSSFPNWYSLPTFLNLLHRPWLRPRPCCPLPRLSPLLWDLLTIVLLCLLCHL